MNQPFIEINKKTTSDSNLLLWKFENEGKKIKIGDKLFVRKNQIAVFLKDGKICDLFYPGLYTLSTENIPILSRLKGWKYDSNSAFNADLYFVNTHKFINNEWSTQKSILIHDVDFDKGSMYFFGYFDIQIVDFIAFFRQYASNFSRFSIFEIQRELENVILPKIEEVLVIESLSIQYLTSNMLDLSKKIESFLKPYFSQFGINLVNLTITNITIVDEVTHSDKKTNVNLNELTYEKISDAKKLPKNKTQSAMMLGIMMNQIQQTKHQNIVAREDTTEN